ncbi:hypothetical protein ACWGH7_31175 [Streptomyces cyaneofuscatus]|uniref:hypothetical protein n=1 Tax=Streptomyces cyaneofuscatus TaxID=66883 RepID=UPI002FF154B9
MTSAAPAELGKWERIARLLADAAPGIVYDPDSGDVVQAEPAADPRPPPREAELREAMRIAARADELQALRPWPGSTLRPHRA